MICGRCGRKLKDPVSIQIGYGPVCRSELGIKTELKKTRKRQRNTGVSVPKELMDIPGQTSIFEHPEWLPDEMKGEQSE